ncbi:TPA: fimbrial protein [Escherichia coli]|nr:fimbrial protein [Escherichia coli]
MKKSIIASIVALGLVSGLAQAADKEVQFVGSVTTVTCDIDPSVDGSNSMMPGVIQLGSVKTGEAGTPVDFTFKPSAASQTDCDAMLDNGTVSLTWTSDKFTNDGLGAISGAATDAHVEITPQNANGVADFIKANGTTHEFSPTTLKTGGDGLKYQAALRGGQVAGDFQSAAKFNFSYK